MSRRLVYFSRFLPSLERGGGSRRLLQLIDALTGTEFELVSSASTDWLSPKEIQDLKSPMALPPFWLEDLPLWAVDKQQSVCRLRRVAAYWSERLPADLTLALVDDPIYFWPLVQRLKELGIPWVAVCHNLESLSTAQISPGSSAELLGREIGLLRQAAAAITISHEETWLLTNLDIPVHHLPYFPVEPIRRRLDDVRRKRAFTAQEGILMIGTAMNPPTREGMELTARFWQERELHRVAGPLQLAGFSSDKFFHQGQFGPGVDILGSLTDDSHDTLLSRVEACLCYQKNGSGALTRITEMRLAGVPVLANTHAARSFHGSPGLREFEDLSTLAAILSEQGHGSATFPPPLAPDASFLVPLLNRLGAV